MAETGNMVSEATSAPSMTDHKFEEPKKLIKGMADMQRWTKSQAYCDFVGIVNMLSTAVKGKTYSQVTDVPEICTKLQTILDELISDADDIPPIDQPQRFGNKAFKTWHARLCEKSQDLVKRVLPPELSHASVELKTYLEDSFGNNVRIDYGTGHEMNYAVFLCCLFKLRVLTEADAAAVVLVVFKKYLDLVRKLQIQYRMEPAGSHGVWGLDDFQFLPFIWGSAQHIDNIEDIQPSVFSEIAGGARYKDEYMFMGCLAYIDQVKTGPFYEHSNMIWSLSNIQTWNKINSGLIKMYKAEVLAKFPIIQHFLFGTLMTLDPA